MSNESLLKKKVNMENFFFIYVILIIVGKIVRWTFMKRNIVDMSKGWGYPSFIINYPLSFQFFGIEEATEGDIGVGSNVFSIFRVFWFFMLCIPETFKEFEFAITIVWGILLFLVIRRCNYIVDVFQFSYIVLSSIVISVYDLSLGKEPIQMLYFFLLYAVLVSNKIPYNYRTRIGLGVILFSAMTFRTYYILILFFGFAFYYLTKVFRDNVTVNDKKIKYLYYIELFGAMCIVYFIVMVVLRVTKGDLFVRMRDALLTASAATSSSNTYIENIIAEEKTSNIFFITVEYGLACIRLLFPFELIPLGPKYWPYIIYQLLMTAFMIIGINTYDKLGKIQRFAVAIFVGYVFCSACFEVDFGAWVRHNSTTFPLVLIISGAVNTDNEENFTNDIGIKKTNKFGFI